MLYKIHRRNRGFTLVEVMVVLVIIAVLMIIGTYAYNDVMQQAKIASIKGDLSNAYYALKNSRSDYGVYPTTISCASAESETNKCVRTSNGNTVTAYQVRVADPQNFCISISNTPLTYSIDKDQNLSSGICPVFSVDAANKTSYPGSGNILYDVSGNSNDGTIYGATYSSSGGGSFDFDGVDDNINFGFPSVFNFNMNSYSYGGWVKVTSSAGGFDMLWHNGGASAGYNGFDMELGTGDWEAGFSDGTTGRSTDISTSTGSLLGNWEYMLVIVNRSNNTIKTYLNGQATGFSTDITGLGGTTPSCSSSIGIGSDVVDYPFKGLVGGFRVYPVALSSSEIIDNYNSQKGRYGL